MQTGVPVMNKHKCTFIAINYTVYRMILDHCCTFRNREKNRKKAKELLREGKAKEARECFQRCVDITSEMAADTIKACRARNIDVIGNCVLLFSV